MMIGGFVGRDASWRITWSPSQPCATRPKYLSDLQTKYAVMVASAVATNFIYSLVSNASLICPLGETDRLCVTQDLANFKLALEQLVFKGGHGALAESGSGRDRSCSHIAGRRVFCHEIFCSVRQAYYGKNILQYYCNPTCNINIYCNVSRPGQYILQCLADGQ